MQAILKTMALACVAAATLTTTAQPAQAAHYGHRQYYSSWTYQPSTRAHYRRYYYRPSYTTRTYRYHYVIRFSSRPRYRYYYNPVRRVYWGRYEVDALGNAAGYSMLEPEHRKGSLNEIPECAFLPAAAMPTVPEAEDGELMLEPPADLPDELK